MMDQGSERFKRFSAHKYHPYLYKQYTKLSVEDLVFCRDFCMLTSELSDDDFVSKVNRLSLDLPLEKRLKNLINIWALLIQSVPPRIRKRRV